MKNNKGITLIALVITIIVLLILVGVTLAMISGESSIFKKAVTAREETFKAQAKEVAGVVVSEVMTEYYDAKYVNKDADVKSTELVAYLKEHVTDKESEYSDWLTYAAGVFTIDDGSGITGTIGSTGALTWSDAS